MEDQAWARTEAEETELSRRWITLRDLTLESVRLHYGAARVCLNRARKWREKAAACEFSHLAARMRFWALDQILLSEWHRKTAREARRTAAWYADAARGVYGDPT